MPVEPLLGFAFFYLCAKLLERGLPFYGAAGLFVVTDYFGEWLLRGFEFAPFMLLPFLLQLGAALVIFYLLKKYEDSVAAWLVTFGVGVIILVILL